MMNSLEIIASCEQEFGLYSKLKLRTKVKVC